MVKKFILADGLMYRIQVHDLYFVAPESQRAAWRKLPEKKTEDVVAPSNGKKKLGSAPNGSPSGAVKKPRVLSTPSPRQSTVVTRSANKLSDGVDKSHDLDPNQECTFLIRSEHTTMRHN